MQVIKTHEPDALHEAKILSGANPYVIVILSKGKYYIETEPTMIRTWETVIAEFENGIQINKPV